MTSDRGCRVCRPVRRPEADLADLDELLEQLDEMEHQALGSAERILELRGRIETHGEIEISLGIEPPAIASEDSGESNEDES